MTNDTDDVESMNSSEDEKEKDMDATIQKLILESEANPYQYDKHVELITVLRRAGDLDQLRNARESMSMVYPLSEELWLEWFQDELPLAIISEQKEYLLSKFELAVKDYTSTKIWHEYCQFVMNYIESPSDIDRARNVFENAITAVGLHVTEGASVWDGYREFEIAILDSYQQLNESEDTVGMATKVQAQTERISSIFKRQLSVPLLGMDDTFTAYEDWEAEPVSDLMERTFEKARDKLTLCMEFEEILHATSGPKLAEYEQYISFEMKTGDPARIQCIFERAIKDNCLQQSLWEKYTDYLDYKLKIPNIAVNVHARAIRNCPWVSRLWVNYMKALERTNVDHSKFKEVFDESLKGGFSGAESYLEVWVTSCDYHRRRVTDWKPEANEVEELHKTFEAAVTYMNQCFGLEGDKYCVLLREWAFIEAKHLNNVKRAQELWDTVMKKQSRDVNMWLEYIQLLMLFGDMTMVRRLFQRSVQISFDFPETICEAFLRFERRYGALDDVDNAQQKVDVQLQRVKERRAKDALKEISVQKAPDQKKSRHQVADDTRKKKKKKNLQEKQPLKRRADTALDHDQHSQPKQKRTQGFDDVPPIVSETNSFGAESTSHAHPSSQSTPVAALEPLSLGVKTTGESTAEMVTDQTRTDLILPRVDGDVQGTVTLHRTDAISFGEESTTPQTNVQDRLTEMSTEEPTKVDNDRSVFLSNLLFTVGEKDIKEMFSPCGLVDTVRIILNRAGKSKGFAYLEFKNKESVKKALELDRTNLSGRPVFVSECVDKKVNPTKFKFPTTIDKQTLYVSNIPFEFTEEQLRAEFEQVGKLKQVRLVTNRSGKFKGYAYVEYENEADATAAILKFDQYVLNGRPINVAVSNPPARKNPEKQQEREQQASSARATYNQPYKPKTQDGSSGRVKINLSLVPRSLKKTAVASNAQKTLKTETSSKQGSDATDKNTGVLETNTGAPETTAVMSNSDFRKFLK